MTERFWLNWDKRIGKPFLKAYIDLYINLIVGWFIAMGTIFVIDKTNFSFSLAVIVFAIGFILLNLVIGGLNQHITYKYLTDIDFLKKCKK